MDVDMIDSTEVLGELEDDSERLDDPDVPDDPEVIPDLAEELPDVNNEEEEENVTEGQKETEESTVEPENRSTSPQDQESSKIEKLTQFPLARVRHIMKMDPDLNMASQDAVFLVTKALELFVESLALEAYSYTATSKKKTISKEDVFKAVDAVDALAFLDGALEN